MALVLRLKGEGQAGHEGVDVEGPARSALSLSFHPTHPQS